MTKPALRNLLNVELIDFKVELIGLWLGLKGLALVVRRLDNAIQWISVNKTNHAIRWIVSYPVDSVIHLSKNQGLGTSVKEEVKATYCYWESGRQ